MLELNTLRTILRRKAPMRSLGARALVAGIAGLLGGCSTVHVPLRPIDPAAYAVDEEFFLAELSRIAGSGATNCGYYHPVVGNNAQGVACVRRAWGNHHE